MPFDNSHHKIKRLALFSGNYNYVMDGPVRALNKLVGYLEKQNIEVLVFAPTVKEPAFKHQGTLISVPSFAVPGRSEYRLGLGLNKRIKQQLKDFKPDLVHLSAPDILGRSALNWARNNNIPAVASFHTRFDTYPRYYGLAWFEPLLTRYMRRFYHACEHVYVPSQSMIDVLTEQNMASDLRIWTRGVDMDIFNPARRDMSWRRSIGIEDDEIVISFVGRLVLEKGLGLYADVIDQLKRKGLKVRGLVVGDGPERQRFQTKLPCAVFLGFQNGTDLARAYASSDLFFNGSITETFGNVTLEAMACGLPSICADATGSRTLVADQISGCLIPLKNKAPDVAAFTEKAALLVQNEAQRQSMGKEALRRAENYSWDSVLGNLLTQYQEVLADRHTKDRQAQANDLAG